MHELSINSEEQPLKGLTALVLSCQFTTRQDTTLVSIVLAGRGVTFLVYALQLIIFSLAILSLGKTEAISLSMLVME